MSDKAKALDVSDDQSDRPPTGLDCPDAPWGPPGIHEKALRGWMKRQDWLEMAERMDGGGRTSLGREEVFRSVLDALIFKQPENRCVLHGLTAKPELNGCTVFVLGARGENEESERYPVELRRRGQVEKMSVRPANLWPFTHKLHTNDRLPSDEAAAQLGARLREAHRHDIVPASSPLPKTDELSAAFGFEAQRAERQAANCHVPYRSPPEASTDPSGWRTRSSHRRSKPTSC